MGLECRCFELLTFDEIKLLSIKKNVLQLCQSLIDFKKIRVEL